MNSENIYVPFSKVWTDEETNILISLWDGSRDYTKLLDALPRFNKDKIYKKAEYLGIVEKVYTQWTSDEIELLKMVWGTSNKTEDILHLFPGKSFTVIRRKAYSMKLKKTEEVLSVQKDNRVNLLIHRNQNILGEKQSYERSKKLAESCDSKQEFKKKHNSAYRYAQLNGFLDEICNDMVVGDSFSYPQAFLFECLKCIYPDEKILYNDRKTIYPKELDVYIPSLKLAFEYDGANYHQNVDDDKVKNEICVSRGITLYRIQEKSKINPEPVIISALEEIGFDCSHIDVEEATNTAFNNKISPKTISERVDKFTTIKEFRRGDRGLYNLLRNKKLLDRYCSHLTPDDAPITKEDILECFKSKKTKNEVLSDPYSKRCYMKFKRHFHGDKEINEAYEKLKGNCSPS